MRLSSETYKYKHKCVQANTPAHMYNTNMYKHKCVQANTPAHMYTYFVKIVSCCVSVIKSYTMEVVWRKDLRHRKTWEEPCADEGARFTE